MLRVSTKGEYGVRIMVDLARYYGGRPRSLTDISQAETLPLAYLEQLVKLLREADPPLVVSTRGAHGGYKLSRDPAEITMGEVVRVLEGPIAPMICATEGEMTQVCNFIEACKTKYLWTKVRDAVAQTLDSMTLAELAAVSMHDQGTAAQFIALSDIHVGLGSSDELCLPAKDGETKVRPLP
ncbi:AsnC family transcriptional regulator [Dictyobacter alpinus]|uniref:AsnC family transcriptional regulator n=1 Tax=Dictyobacter alpinus TaxID=2014873 RepID=A0A402B5Z5_9CHLR|nr:Rrf2 family transcriptional regulator [Dictyobacter alpinus]GCE26776.1 AsnC family transcriptional regulator [Dictyobacter alpinus]